MHRRTPESQILYLDLHDIGRLAEIVLAISRITPRQTGGTGLHREGKYEVLVYCMQEALKTQIPLVFADVISALPSY
jgi:hypothetical protein